MKKLLIIGICVSVMLCGNGCKSPELAAYKTLGSIALTVNAAKHAYEEYRTYNKVSKETDIRIQGAYLQYQGAMHVAEDLQKSIKTSTAEGKETYERLLLSVEAASANFIGLIKQFIPQYNL